jgi:hypothetical protein
MNFDWLQALMKHECCNPNALKILETRLSSVGQCHSPLYAASEKGTNAKHVLDVNAVKQKEGTIQPGDC